MKFISVPHDLSLNHLHRLARNHLQVSKAEAAGVVPMSMQQASRWCPIVS